MPLDASPTTTHAHHADGRRWTAPHGPLHFVPTRPYLARALGCAAAKWFSHNMQPRIHVSFRTRFGVSDSGFRPEMLKRDQHDTTNVSEKTTKRAAQSIRIH